MATLQTGSTALRTRPTLRPIDVNDFRGGIPDMQAAEAGVLANQSALNRLQQQDRLMAIEEAVQADKLALAEAVMAGELAIQPADQQLREMDVEGKITNKPSEIAATGQKNRQVVAEAGNAATAAETRAPRVAERTMEEDAAAETQRAADTQANRNKLAKGVVEGEVIDATSPKAVELALLDQQAKGQALETTMKEDQLKALKATGTVETIEVTDGTGTVWSMQYLKQLDADGKELPEKRLISATHVRSKDEEAERKATSDLNMQMTKAKVLALQNPQPGFKAYTDSLGKYTFGVMTTKNPTTGEWTTKIYDKDGNPSDPSSPKTKAPAAGKEPPAKPTPSPVSKSKPAQGGYQVGRRYGDLIYQGGDINDRGSWTAAK